MPEPSEVIRFDGVRLAFGRNVGLRGVGVPLPPGGKPPPLRGPRDEPLVLLGVTGTGKPLILKLALGLLQADAGRIRVLGTDITDLEEEALFPLREKLGIVFQEMALFDSLNVYENVAYRLIEETVHGDLELSGEEIEGGVRGNRRAALSR